MRIRLIVTSILLLLWAQVNADIIDAHSTNTEYAPGKYADLQGLQWLTLDETLGESYDSIISGYKGLTNDGWRYATRQETETLLGSLWGATVSGWSQDNADGAIWFTSVFVRTISAPGSYFPTFDHSLFLFGNLTDCETDLTIICSGAVSYLIRGATPGSIDSTTTDGNMISVVLQPFEDYGYLHESDGLNVGYDPFNTSRLTALSNNQHASLLVRPISPVTIDIKTGSDPNSINPRSTEVIPVAVLGSTNFDAIQVDPTKVRFGPNGATLAHNDYIDDVNNDGFMDAVFHFRTGETGIVCGDTEATLNGEIFDGTPIAGTDTVNTVGCHGTNSSKDDATASDGASMSWTLFLVLGVLGLLRLIRLNR